mmetsp:Transcript_36811/g.56357  ORF Transcript_36811/g.56357 Transcript_36811/m.56357 type:complete len:264 (-) Transcript_36811:36-827(-)
MTSQIISTEELQAMLGNHGVKILDCSVQMGRQPGDDSRVNFLKEHIKGAQFLDLDNFKDQRSELPFMLPDEKYFIDTMKRLCIKLSDTVVCYDAGAMQLFGYRAAWMLETMGHPNVKILDGGFPKWKKEGRHTEGSDERAEMTDFNYTFQPNKLKTLDQVKAFEQNNSGAFVLDGRAPDQYTMGNINGSKNIPLPMVLNMQDKTMKSAEERKKAYEEAGVNLNSDITLTCQGGIAASVLYSSLRDIAKGNLAVYDGSWAEYSK